MPDLSFQVHSAEPQFHSASPLLMFKIGIVNTSLTERIHTVSLRCQIQIEATRRHYTADERDGLIDLFGDPERWNQTLRTMLWTHTSVIAPAFTESAVVDVPVPCTFDFNVAATKYFAGLEDGEVPLCLQFSGTIFYEGAYRTLQVAQIPWNKEARYRLPVNIWQDMMDAYYPNSAWLRLPRDVFNRFHQFKMRRGIPTPERALEMLLEAEEKQLT
jgi:hypothetical protein